MSNLMILFLLLTLNYCFTLDCLQNKCKNGGLCVQIEGKTICQCPPPFYGAICQYRSSRGIFCDEGWKLSTTQTCLKYFEKRLSFKDASSSCIDSGGWLMGLASSFKEPNTYLNTHTKLLTAFTDVSIFLSDTRIWLGMENHDEIIYSKYEYPKFYGKSGEDDFNGYYIKSFDSIKTCSYLEVNKFGQRPSLNSIYDVGSCSHLKSYICEKSLSEFTILEKTKFCPEGWYYSQDFNACLKYIPTPLPFQNASNACKLEDSHISWPKSLKFNIMLTEISVLTETELGCGLYSPCKNGGSCFLTKDGFSNCLCPIDYTGKFCENSLVKNVCASNPCGDGGICIPLPTGFSLPYVCICRSGIAMSECSNDICSLISPCGQYGSCVTDPSKTLGFKCYCTSNYEGEYCEISKVIKDCPNYSCGSYKQCKLIPSQGLDITCVCPAGRYGDKCELAIPTDHPCKTNPCKNNGLCVPITPYKKDYYCACQSKFLGDKCEQREVQIPGSSLVCNEETTTQCPVCSVSGNLQECMNKVDLASGCKSCSIIHMKDDKTGMERTSIRCNQKSCKQQYTCLTSQPKCDTQEICWGPIECQPPNVCTTENQHGKGCNYVCRCEGPCEDSTGTCLTGKCKVDWYGTKCDIKYTPIEILIGVRLLQNEMVFTNGAKIDKSILNDMIIDKKNGNCFKTTINGDWKSIQCNEKHTFVCQKKPNYDNFEQLEIKRTSISTIKDLGIECVIPKDISKLSKSVYWRKDNGYFSFTNPKNRINTTILLDNLKVLNGDPLISYSSLEGSYSCVINLPMKQLTSKPIQITLNEIRVGSIVKFHTSPSISYASDLGVTFTLELRNLISTFLLSFIKDSVTIEVDLKEVRSGSVIVENTIYIQQNMALYKYNLDYILDTLEDFLKAKVEDKEFFTLFQNYQYVKAIEFMSLFTKNVCRKSRIKHNKYGYEVEFKTAKVGEKSYTLRKCLNGKPLAVSDCELSNYGYPKRVNFVWTPEDECYPSKTYRESTEMLKNISRKLITEDNVENITQETEIIARNNELKSLDISYISMIIENIKASRIKPPMKATSNIIKISNEILKVSENEIMDSNDITQSSTVLVQSLETIADRTVMPDKRKGVRMFTPRISIDIWEGSNAPFNSYVVKRMKGDGLLSNDSIVAEWNNHSISLSDSVASIFFEESLKLEGKFRVVTTVYSNKKFFLKKNMSVEPAGKIISASISNFRVHDIDPPICSVFLPDDIDLSTVTMNSHPRCVYWNFERDEWLSDGCSYNRTYNGRVFCQCDHFTNFAVLLDVERTGDPGHEALSYISIIGLSLSTAGLAFIIVSFFVIRYLRTRTKRRNSQIALFNLALALIAVNIVFLVGIRKTENRNGCIAVSALLYYFLLSSFFWMLAEGVITYINFVKVFDNYISNFMLKSLVCCWGKIKIKYDRL
ncbi:DgyrCDS2582 [Dimorphilus gyrociliatus]|uniref:DgyrCDS2582 n=1 Tax=Dimorphilus gyrociliatus TaxID=2664684 RepID=A0A7I8VCI7_9ANNE|nr:DgyrCDS2582 [Dimorphilus gyrociliatus]